MIAALLVALTLASFVYWVVALVLVRRFFAAAPDWSRPTSTDDAPLPGVSILKPVKGVDAEAYENFASFCRQNYPRFELVFGVSDATDAAVELIRRLKREFPRVDIRLVVGGARGANRKAALLHELAAQAKHAVFVASDSDMRVGPEYLRRVVAPLADAEVALVTCPYRGARPRSFAARLEALHMGAVFLPSVVVARRVLQMRFALGATVAMRRADLESIGGFAAVSRHLADDFQLGARLAERGRVELSREVVDSVLGAPSLRDELHRELRWARCARVSQSWGYFGYWLSFSTPLALLAFAALDFSRAGLALVAASIVLRLFVAAGIARRTGDRASLDALLLLPLRDLQTALVWCAGAFGRQVRWRGELLRLRRDGRLERLGAASTPATVTRLPGLRAPQGAER